MDKGSRSRTLRFLARLVYVLAAATVVVVALEFAARAMGLGDPVLYYNAAWGGMRPVPNQRVARVGGAGVTIDAGGYRTARTPSDSTALRVLYLGDSVTWGGSRVDDAEIFSEVAADAVRAARSVEVYAMNAGVNGAAVVNQAEIFHHLDVTPDAVVWLIPYGDLRRTYVTVGYLWPQVVKPRYALVEAVDHVIRALWLPALRRDDGQSAGLRDLSAELENEDSWAGRQVRQRIDKNLATLGAALDTMQARGIPVVFGFTPRVRGDSLLPDPHEAADVLERVARRGFRTLDLQSLMAGRPSLAALYQDEVHFTAEGHRVVGEAVGRALVEELERRDADGPAGRADEPE